MVAAHQASLSFTTSWSLLKLLSIEFTIPSNHFLHCRPLLLLSSIFLRIRVSSNESAFPIRWPRYWSFNFSSRPSNEYSGLVFFRIDFFELLAVQETLKSLFQHQFKSIHSSVLSHLYRPALTLIHNFWDNHSLDYLDLCRQGCGFPSSYV